MPKSSQESGGRHVREFVPGARPGNGKDVRHYWSSFCFAVGPTRTQRTFVAASDLLGLVFASATNYLREWRASSGESSARREKSVREQPPLVRLEIRQLVQVVYTSEPERESCKPPPASRETSREFESRQPESSQNHTGCPIPLVRTESLARFSPSLVILATPALTALASTHEKTPPVNQRRSSFPSQWRNPSESLRLK